MDYIHTILIATTIGTTGMMAGNSGVTLGQKKNNVAFVRMREREEKLRKAMGIPEPIGEHKHERYDYRPASLSSSSSSFSSSIPSYNAKKVKGNARQDLLFTLKCDKEGREVKKQRRVPSAWRWATPLARANGSRIRDKNLWKLQRKDLEVRVVVKKHGSRR